MRGGIVRHIIILVIAHSFWAAGAAAQSTNPNVVLGGISRSIGRSGTGCRQNIVLSVATT